MKSFNTFPVYDGGERGYASVLHVESGLYTFPAATVATSTVIQGLVIPKNQRITGLVVKADDADSNGSPTLVFSIGDSGNASRYLASSTLAQAGGVTTAMAAAGVNFVTTADTIITLTINTQAATQTAGATIFVQLQYEEA